MTDRFAAILSVLEARGSVVKRGQELSACCPAHDDQRASLTLRQTGDGTILLKCHAGCGAGEIMAAMGMRLSDLMPPLPSPGNGHAGKGHSENGHFGNGHFEKRGRSRGRIVATHDYVDEHGRMLFQVCRFESKHFGQRTPQGDGWKWSTQGVRRVLYRLPELIATDPRQCVFVVEGEKDCDRLRALGFVATTNAGGAGKWLPEYAAFLQGRPVAIIADHDEPGRKHAEDVAYSLSGAAECVRVLTLPGLPEHGDVSDWLDAGGTKDGLLDLVDGARRWTPAGPAAADAHRPAAAAGPVGRERPRGGLRMLEMSAVVTQQVEWLWPGRIARGKIHMLSGQPGLGKTWTTCDLAARISRGEPWPDGAACAPGRVLMVTAEDGIADTIKPRLDISGADCDMIQVIDGRILAAGDADVVQFSIMRDLDALDRVLHDYGDVAMLIMDPVTAFLGENCDSNNNAEVRAVLGPLAKLAERHNIAVVCISHFAKNGQGAAINRTLGSLAFVAAARIAFGFVKDPDDPSGRSVLMLPLKNNIAARPAALAYQIDNEGIHWQTGPVNVDIDDVLNRKPGKGLDRLEEAKRLILESLAEGALDSDALKAHVMGKGEISFGTFRRAKEELSQVRTRKQPGRGGKWVTFLEEGLRLEVLVWSHRQKCVPLT